MNAPRRVGLGLGVSLFVLGLAYVLVPDLADVLSATGLVAALGADYFLGAAVAALAVVGALVVATERLRRGFDQATPPPVGTAPRGRRPGEGIDTVLAGDLGPWEHLRGDQRASVRSRLREAAVGAVARAERCPREDARRRVAAGSWTEDTVAAAFLAAEDGPALPGRLLDAVPGRSQFEHRARRAVAAIMALDQTEGDA